jgi:hypothetical protein
MRKHVRGRQVIMFVLPLDGMLSCPAAMLRRQSTIKHQQTMWYDTMEDAVKHTIIISEILDTRTRHLVQVLSEMFP